MTAPLRDSTLTSTSQITVTWSALSLANSGYAAVLSYHLQWDAGTSGSSWVDLVGSSVASTALTFTVTTNVIAGRTYNFRVRARNVWGWGAYSNSIAVKAATRPGDMQAVTTSIDTATGGVKIQWVAPASNS